MGNRCKFALISFLELTARFIWMATFGKIKIGRLKSKKRLSTCNGELPFKLTLPANDKGRSNQVL